MFVVDVRSRATSCGAENDGQAARFAHRHDRVGKIAALQRDLEEEPQGSGADVDGRHRRSDRRQPQLIAMDILGGGLVGRPAQEIGKPIDVADIVELRLGAEPADRHGTCSEATARCGAELGYHVTLVRDATAAFSPEAMHAAHEINGPTFAHAILTTDGVIAALTKG
jgi:Isochorismatase family